ncbi:MAG: TfoX/Sxy family protein [Verrucomicrobia bacterium]|nr:TfoX/Sxy family protein [Chloroflexota bacterium]MBU1694457.1 TfoX/Sxy family protein [Verrucomicrobiota bacterium]MBU1880032.1 TfoX/Sxy family protein [Chloroflexota bacterium]
MAYNEDLAQRIRQVLDELEPPGLVEKNMFGGVGFMVRGNMACGVHKDRLIVRVGPEGYQEALARPHAGLFDITGRPMTGWVTVAAGGYETQSDLEAWVREGVGFALTLPAK